LIIIRVEYVKNMEREKQDCSTIMKNELSIFQGYEMPLFRWVQCCWIYNNKLDKDGSNRGQKTMIVDGV